MRYLFCIILSTIYFASNVSAQGPLNESAKQKLAVSVLNMSSANYDMDTTSIKKMIQGDWQQKDDATFTLTITNDTIMEVSRGDNPGTDTFVFKVTQTNCSKDALNSSLTGFYLDELNINNNKRLCGSIDFVSDTKLKLSYGDQLMEFIRPQ